LKDMWLPLLWWGKHIGIACISFSFLIFGFETLADAYRMKNPIEFMMFFFSSNLIILISAVGILFPLIRIHRRFKSMKKQE